MRAGHLPRFVRPQNVFPLFVRRELDGRIGDDPGHCGRVAPPQAEQTFVPVALHEEPDCCPCTETHFSRLFKRKQRCYSTILHIKSFKTWYLKDDLGPVQRSNHSLGQAAGHGAGAEVNHDNRTSRFDLKIQWEKPGR